MDRLPKVRRIPPPEWQRHRLACWLLEWRLDRAMAEGGLDAGCCGAERVVARSASAARGGPVAPGQVLLLAPETPGAGRRPACVAVLEDTGRGRFLIAPFSRFTEPATPGEWLTGCAAPGLAVLCLWNVDVMEELRLGRAWTIGRLTAAQLQRALRVRASIGCERPLPGRLAREVGPPLVHLLDPRREYLREERALWRGESAGGRPDAPDERPPLLLAYPQTGERAESLPKAAETRAAYQARPGRRGGSIRPAAGT